MWLRLATFVAVVVAAIAVLASLRSGPEPRPPYTTGRNNTVLFLATKHWGFSNIHFAAAFALLERYPDLEIHYASGAGRQDELVRISAAAKAKNPRAREAVWHEIGGVDYVDAMESRGFLSSADVMQEPGLPGIGVLASRMDSFLSPWTGEQHWEQYCSARDVVEKVDPAVVVVDMFFQPGVDYLRQANRFYAALSPNAVTEILVPKLPYGQLFWKYPAYVFTLIPGTAASISDMPMSAINPIALCRLTESIRRQRRLRAALPYTVASDPFQHLPATPFDRWHPVIVKHGQCAALSFRTRRQERIGLHGLPPRRPALPLSNRA